MKKRLFALFVCLILTFSVCGCSNTTKTKKENKKTTTEEAKTEETASTDSENMIQNGDFSGGQGAWNTYTNGGSATLSVNGDQQLQIDISDPGTLDYAVQAYYDGFKLESGCKYEFSFDISSTVDRKAEWRMQINGGDYHAYVSDVVDVTKEMTHISKTFDMTEASDPAPRLCLNLGMVKGCPDSLGEHSVMVDNFVLKLADDTNKVQEQEKVKTPDINVDQVGYQTKDKKTAVLRGDSIDKEFSVVNVDSGKTVFTGEIEDEKDNDASAEHTAIADFSKVTEPGQYKIVSKTQGESDPFSIGDDSYNKITKETLKMLYLQRCGEELDKKTAGAFAHPACHTAEATIYGTKEKKEVSGGWHDAGDYGRYVVSGAKAVADLLLAYEKNPSAFADDIGIPESGNSIPDVLDEVKYETDWMLKMQDDKSGGVYHKVTCANFPETVMPQDETDELILSPISTAATGDFAAAMTMMARVYKSVNAEYSDTCLKAAKKAMDYVNKHMEDDTFKNPNDIVTGEYPDKNVKDEQFWALAELYKTTGEDSYHKQLKKINILSASGGFGWADVGYYGIWAYMTSQNQDEAFKKTLMERWDYALTDIRKYGKADAYNCTLGEDYCWGSNMCVADNAMMLLMNAQLTGKASDQELAKEQLHYLFGKNSTGYCFVTGFGTLSPNGPHHRPSQVQEKAMKGMLVGGPDCNLEDPYAKAVLKGTAKAQCYVDSVQSFSCNEITVYWNSPLIYLLSEYAK